MPPQSNNSVAQKPVPGGECWYTVLTNSDHVTRGGTIHSQALKGKRIAENVGDPWCHEMSGRLVSLSGDIAAIEDDALRRVADARNNFTKLGNLTPSKISFSGFGCAKAAEIRGMQRDNILMDIIYTPILMDNAHADLVLYGTKDNDALEIAKAVLIRILRVVRPAYSQLLVTSCGITAA